MRRTLYAIACRSKRRAQKGRGMVDFEVYKGDGKIKSYYGLYINIAPEVLKLISEGMQIDAEHKAEVVVNYMGEQKEFKIYEFLEKLGFNAPDEDRQATANNSSINAIETA
jgi:hypothetical protein